MLLQERNVTRKLLAVLFVGAVLSADADVVFPTNSHWRYFKGSSEASSPNPTAWRTIDFNDASWTAGQAPFYYENQPGGATSYTGNTLLGDMFGGCSCILLAKTL